MSVIIVYDMSTVTAYARALLEQGPTIAHVSAKTYPDVLPYLNDEGVIERMRACLNLVMPPDMARANRRVFIKAGLLISCFHGEVFDASVSAPIRALETELTALAQSMMGQFEAIVRALASQQDVPDEQMAGFHTALRVYYAKFQTWKAGDETRIVTRAMHSAFVLCDRWTKLEASVERRTRAILEEAVTKVLERYHRMAGRVRYDGLMLALVDMFPQLPLLQTLQARPPPPL